MSVVSGILAADATNNATDSAEKQQQAATLEHLREFNITQENFAPYKAIGEAATPRFQDFINGKTDIANDPLYKNQMTQATREAAQRAAGSGQSTQGGAFQTRLAHLSNQIYDNTFQTKYQQLTDALKVGQGAAGSIQNGGQVFGNQVQQGANNMGNIAMNNGNTQASLYGGMSGQAGSLLGKIGSQNGWWNGSGAGNGELYNSVGGNINKVDFESGGGWGNWSNGSSAASSAAELL